MSMQMQIKYFCDNDKARHSDRTDGDTLVLRNEKTSQIQEIELCEQCQGKLSWQKVQVIVQEFGRDLDDRGPELDRVCPYGCRDGAPFKTLALSRQHMRRQHPAKKAA